MSGVTRAAVALIPGLFLLTASPGHAVLPSGEEVIRGDVAEFDRSDENVLRVRQDSSRAIIEWDRFSIGADNEVIFEQESGSWAVLNRVTGGDLTEIRGNLGAAGRIYLINPAGVLVGQSGVVEAHSFIASALDVDNDDFWAGGDLVFEANGVPGSVRNRGEIHAGDGNIFLFGSTVENDGLLSAGDGIVGIASGSRLLLRGSGTERVFVELGIDAGDSDTAAVWNAGEIEAVSAELKAVRGNHFALAINNEGVVRARTATNRGGRIVLSADGGVDNAGALDASGESEGGRVRVEGGRVVVREGGLVDASGPTAGEAGSGAISLIGTDDEIRIDGEVRGQGNMRFVAGTDIRIGESGVVDNASGAGETLFVVDNLHPDRPDAGDGRFANHGNVNAGERLLIYAVDRDRTRLGNLGNDLDGLQFDTWAGEIVPSRENLLLLKEEGIRIEDRSRLPSEDLFDRLTAIYDPAYPLVSDHSIRFPVRPERHFPMPELIEPGRLGETGLSGGEY